MDLFIITISLSVLSYYFIEKPILNTRPNYKDPLKKKTFKNSLPLNLTLNFLVFCFVLWFAEFSTGKIKFLYYHFYVHPTLAKQNVDINNSKLKDEENIKSKISRDLINANRSDQNSTIMKVM